MQTEQIKYNELNEKYIGKLFKLTDAVISSGEQLQNLTLVPTDQDLCTLSIQMHSYSCYMHKEVKPKMIKLFVLTAKFKDGERVSYFSDKDSTYASKHCEYHELAEVVDVIESTKTVTESEAAKLLGN